MGVESKLTEIPNLPAGNSPTDLPPVGWFTEPFVRDGKWKYRDSAGEHDFGSAGSKTEVERFADLLVSKGDKDISETAYHSKENIGGGARYYRDGTTGTPSSGDEAKFFNADGVGYILDGSGYLSAAVFGVYCDGENYEHIRANAAIAYALSNDATHLLFPSGTLKISQPLAGRATAKDVIIEAEAHKRTVVRPSMPIGWTMDIIGCDTSGNPLGVEVIGFTAQPSGAASVVGDGRHGIRLRNASKGALRKNYVDGFKGGTGLQYEADDLLNKGADSNVIESNYVTECGSGFVNLCSGAHPSSNNLHTRNQFDLNLGRDCSILNNGHSNSANKILCDYYKVKPDGSNDHGLYIGPNADGTKIIGLQVDGNSNNRCIEIAKNSHHTNIACGSVDGEVLDKGTGTVISAFSASEIESNASSKVDPITVSPKPIIETWEDWSTPLTYGVESSNYWSRSGSTIRLNYAIPDGNWYGLVKQYDFGDQGLYRVKMKVNRVGGTLRLGYRILHNGLMVPGFNAYTPTDSNNKFSTYYSARHFYFDIQGTSQNFETVLNLTNAPPFDQIELLILGGGSGTVIDANFDDNDISIESLGSIDIDPNYYHSDGAAASGGVGVGFVYRHTSGDIKTRLS